MSKESDFVDLLNKEMYELKIANLEAKLAESEKENKTLKDIRTLERVVPRNAQLNKLSNRDCYLKGFENAISETIRTFEETYGKEKCKLIEERDKYLMDIVKAGGYEYQIEELKQKLAEKDEEIKQLNNRILFSQLQAPNEQILNILGSQCVQYNPDQDKISFAIDELEKVKDYFIEGYAVCKNFSDFYWNFTEQIDNQIKQLRKGK